MLGSHSGMLGKVPVLTAKTRLVITETLNQKGAAALAKRLQQFWHAKGFPSARFWPEPIDAEIGKVGSCELYRVNCNLVNGLPPHFANSHPPGA